MRRLACLLVWTPLKVFSHNTTSQSVGGENEGESRSSLTHKSLSKAISRSITPVLSPPGDYVGGYKTPSKPINGSFFLGKKIVSCGSGARARAAIENGTQIHRERKGWANALYIHVEYIE
jgi:hypothetical protein